jgi:hypothetical protein
MIISNISEHKRYSLNSNFQLAFDYGVCQGSCRIFFNCFSQSSVHPHLFHGSLDNEPLIACV